MSTEPDDTEDEGYEPTPEHIGDGEALIHDPTEFFDLTDSLAVIVRDGGLFVLDRKTFKWRNVEQSAGAKPSMVREFPGKAIK